MTKHEALANLDIIAEAVMEESGTLRTQGMNYDLAIRRQIEVCDRIGCTREQIQAILDKYQKEFIIKLPTLKRRKND